KSVFLVTKEYSNTDVIVTPEGVAIFYITPDNRDSIARQFVFWEDPRVFEQHAPALDNSVVIVQAHQPTLKDMFYVFTRHIRGIRGAI
ncbi:MAG: hypothetical protein Q8N76_05830, partial [Candidatus Omnitrophota bacterium]|nr:hypothetical protein [Candidatus Omnitrophota bacterium]